MLYSDSKEDSLMDKIRDLLLEQNIDETEFSPELSESQKYAFEKFKNGDSLLILAQAGNGKSFLVKHFLKYIKRNTDKKMYLTSTTGISSYSLSGITINSFMGIGTGSASIDIILKRLRNKIGIKERIKNTDILVIDEISMMSASVFEKLNELCQILRKSRKPFGGMQLIMTGDFLQLETIIDSKEKDKRLIIESEIFLKMFNKNTIVLKTNFRQQGDNLYNNILTRIRLNEQNDDDIKILKSKLTKNYPKDIVNIVSSNSKSNSINAAELSKIKEQEFSYDMSYTMFGNEDECEILMKELSNQLSNIQNIKLKKGCRVLLIKNLDVDSGLVNGSTGIVNDINQDSVNVIFDNGAKMNVSRVEWTLELNGSSIVGKQIPLMLAYSITIHKSQSLSLDKAVLDLGDCFCNHMVYVALSRVKSLDGLYLKSFNEKKITVNEKVINFIKNTEKININSKK